MIRTLRNHRSHGPDANRVPDLVYLANNSNYRDSLCLFSIHLLPVNQLVPQAQLPRVAALLAEQQWLVNGWGGRGSRSTVKNRLLGDLHFPKAHVVIHTQATLASPHPPPFRGALHGRGRGALVSKRGRVGGDAEFVADEDHGSQSRRPWRDSWPADVWRNSERINGWT